MSRRKLIEVSLPLEAINSASSREKSVRLGHPSTLHLWWSRKPLATCRAVLFAQLIDDPGEHPERYATVEAVDAARAELLDLTARLARWDCEPATLARARALIEAQFPEGPPTALDPFCGGGSVPLEAQRLGLNARASDLNPVAVLITAGLIDFPHRFGVRPQAHPAVAAPGVSATPAERLALDVSAYGEDVQREVHQALSACYPALGGSEGGATPLAWLWVRTAPCPNPACGVAMPLASKWKVLERGGRRAWLVPESSGPGSPVRFRVSDEGSPPQGTVRRSRVHCVACGQASKLEVVRAAAQRGALGQRMVAAFYEDAQGVREVVLPDEVQRAAAAEQKPKWRPAVPLQGKCRVSAPLYGMETFADLFTPRQLTALGAYAEALRGLRPRIVSDALAAGWPDQGEGLAEGGRGAQAYADAVVCYLAFALDKCADYWNTLATWMPRGTIGHAFTRQALPMSWDFAEANPLSDFHCTWPRTVGWVTRQLSTADAEVAQGHVRQQDAATLEAARGSLIISTDPPYYDNILYADLSDFFYVWLRRVLRPVFPGWFRTALTPKGDELVATPHRHGGDREAAHEAFEVGLRAVFEGLRRHHRSDCPMTLYYAFKQTRRVAGGGEASTGWEALLEGLLGAGWAITGTWPVRSERSARSVAQGTNALASSIVLVCRPRPEQAPVMTRAELTRRLREVLPGALAELGAGAVLPVDMAQVAIGPGMAVFSRCAAVIEPDGQAMSVRTALALINRTLDEVLGAQDAQLDLETRFALAWFTLHGWDDVAFGHAEAMARARNVTIGRLTEARVLHVGGGQARLLDLSRSMSSTRSWPSGERRWRDQRVVDGSLWGLSLVAASRLRDAGPGALAELIAKAPARREGLAGLARRLHHVCEARRLVQAAHAFNALAVALPKLALHASASS